MRVRTTAFTLAAAAVLLTTTACAAAGTPPGATAATSVDAPRATDPVIEVRLVEAGLSGVTGQVRAVVYADGTLIRSTDDSQWSTTTLEPAEVTALVRRAMPLLDEQPDLGGGRITDSPWSELRVATDAGVREIRVESPGLTDGLTADQLAARESFQRTVDALFAAGKDRPWTPERALAWVEDGNLLDFEFPPPLWTGSLTLHPLSGCVEPEGTDLTLLDQLLEADGFPRTGIDRSITVRTDEGNTVRLRVRDLLPHDPGCP